MWQYEKKLQFPVDIKTPDAKTARMILTLMGGPDGELGASQRYLNQRFAMPYAEVMATLTDIGTEEMAHQEVLSAIIRQLTDGLTPKEIEKSDFAPFYLEHTGGIYPTDSNGVPYTVATFQSKGDPITDLHEDLAAEQKARTAYENVLRLVTDPDVIKPLEFLRQREIVHYQRFGESLGKVLDHLNSKNYYAFNPAFDPKK